MQYAQLKGVHRPDENNKWFFSRCLNARSDSEEVICEGKSFQIHAPATGKARRPSVESLTENKQTIVGRGP